ncbi:cytochrome P450 4C1 isoform X1 [Nasonia vitripennis]|uniref:Cytochrome P450 n=2 Tax=Nasonia vitripennis TaxID=7425 RepID=A0A7M7G5G5_NASVI|nr:cytochrome P450 4C1 isoform X1 [Nasonia vitripennis]
MGPITLVIVYLIIVICVAIAYVSLSEYYELRQTLGHIPGPRNYPFIGSLWRMKRLPREDKFKWFNDLCFTFKNGLVVTWFGMEPVVNIRKPHQIQILSSSCETVAKSRFYKFMSPWLGDGLFSSTEVWFNHRQLIMPALCSNILDEYTAVMHDKADVLTEIMRAKVELNPDSFINILDLVMRYALDTVCESAMGINMDIQRKPENDYVTAFYNCIQISTERYFQSWMRWNFIFHKTKRGKKFLNSVECMHKFTEKVIRQKQIDKFKRPDSKDGNQCGKRKNKAFLDLLLDINQSGNHSLTLEEIRQEIDTFIFAGYETTATAIIWTLFAIGNDPGVQARVHVELENMFGNCHERPTIQQLSQLKYLDRVIKEVLRLYPSLPMISRLLDRNSVIDNYFIPEKTLITIQVYQLHHDPEVWKNPEIFDPDRFLPENSRERHPYAYLPFSNGSRNCIGQKYAILEIKIIVTKILRMWSVKSALKPTEVKLVSDFTLRPFDDKINLYFTPKINNTRTN